MDYIIIVFCELCELNNPISVMIYLLISNSLYFRVLTIIDY